ncbi:MAG: Wzz/FepE/Etk N-terminal domain-containing protein [Elusimicrobia bacterium]|nr:Wzz/FepE/Etk N-terminal domain-containing protein [Elusimicrobiota bacterium]
MEEQEIDFRHYLRILKKRWKLIVYITVTGIMLSVLYVLITPKIYETVALIEPAKIQKVPVETADSLELLLKNPLNPYLKDIAAKMDIQEKKAYNLANRFFIKNKLDYISVEAKGNTPENAKKLADLICSLILKRQDDLMKDALKIINEEINNLNEQNIFIKNDLEQLNKKILRKEMTDVLAQSYIYQALIQSKESALTRQTQLYERLRQKEMELKYYTKSATIVAEASLPRISVSSEKTRTIYVITSLFFIFSIFIVFAIEYFEKEPL